jgi:hypothetical protein
LFSKGDSEKSIFLEYIGDKNGNRVPDVNEIGVNYLQGDGDFRSPESIELLKQSDIVVTNPPFSLFRDFVNQLIKYDKKFIIIGSQNSISNKDLFKLIKENKIWLGYNSVKRFRMPDNYEHNSVIEEDGIKYAIFGNICWYTNIDIEKRHIDLVLYKKYNEVDFPFFDNYNAICVNRVKEIPIDYDGIMGVPITFIENYNPNQFEIIGSDYEVKEGLHPNIVNPNWNGKLDRAYINNKRLFARIFIKHKKI